MKVVICGSRGWSDTSTIWEVIRELPKGSHIIHGGAKGADMKAGEVARQISDAYPEPHFTIEVFRADWDRHGKGAGFIRNNKMLDQDPDKVIAFWNGTSRGTRHTIGEAIKRGIRVKIVYPGKRVQEVPL